MDQEKINNFRAKQEQQAKEQLLADIQAQNLNKVITSVEDVKTATDKASSVINDSVEFGVEKVSSSVKAGSKDVIKKLDELGSKLQPKEFTPVVSALKDVTAALSKLPKSFPEFPEIPEPKEDVAVTNLSELKTYFDSVVKAVGQLSRDIKLDPKIEVKPTDVIVNEKEVDLTPVKDALAKVETAVKNIKPSVFDTTDMVNGLLGLRKDISNLKFPVPNYVLPFRDINDKAVQAPEPFVNKVYDAGTVEYPDATTDIFKFRQGGLSGPVVETITITYTDDTKASMSSWVRS